MAWPRGGFIVEIFDHTGYIPMKRIFNVALTVCALTCSLALIGCESNPSSDEELSVQAKNAVDVLPMTPDLVGMMSTADLRQSDMFGMIEDHMQADDMGEMQDFIEATGFDPMEDLREIYVAVEDLAENDKPSVSFVAYASIEPGRLESYVVERAGDKLTSRTYRGVDLFEGGEGDHYGGFSFVNEDMILMATDVELLENMIDRLLDNSAALGQNSDLMNMVTMASAGKSGWLIAEKPEVQMPGNQQSGTEMGKTAMQIWSALDHMVVALNVESNEVESQFFLYPTQQVSTDDLASLTKGLRSAMRSYPEMDKEAMRVLDDIRVSASNDYVRVQFTADSELIESIRG